MRVGGLRGHSLRAAVQELLLLDFLTYFIRTLGIEPLHVELLLSGKLREVPDEIHQLPTGIGRVISAKGGHAGQSDAIFDYEEELAIAHALGVFSAEIGRLRVHPRAECRLATPIIAVTNRAVIGEVRTSFG